MGQPIYFSKIEFRECAERRENLIFLDLVQRELSYQEFEVIWQMPAIQEGRSFSVGEETYIIDSGRPGRVIRNGKSMFKPQLLPSGYRELKLLYSYGMKLSEEQIKVLLPYCNVPEFEAYRNKTASEDDAGVTGYADTVSVYFRGVTDTHVPPIELSLEYYHEDEYMWPHEKLYLCLRKNFIAEIRGCSRQRKKNQGGY